MADSVVDLINEIELIREQLYDLESRVRDHPDRTAITSAGDAIDDKVIDLEMNLTDIRMSGGMAGQDRLRWPRQLYAKVTSLAGYISGSDFPPTVQEIEVHQRYRRLLAEYEARMAAIRQQDIAEFNALLSDKGLPIIMTADRRRDLSM